MSCKIITIRPRGRNFPNAAVCCTSDAKCFCGGGGADPGKVAALTSCNLVSFALLSDANSCRLQWSLLQNLDRGCGVHFHKFSKKTKRDGPVAFAWCQLGCMLCTKKLYESLVFNFS